VKRHEKIRVKGISPEGQEMEITGEGMLSFALQHEIDHLNGILILDRLSHLKREIYRNRLKKERKSVRVGTTVAPTLDSEKEEKI
jgi:peptide deformylase